MKKTLIALTTFSTIGASTLLFRENNVQNIHTLEDTQSKNQITLPQIKNYISANPEKQEQILNFIINEKREYDNQYSQETLNNLSNILITEINNNPKKAKLYAFNITDATLNSKYGKEALQNFAEDSKLELLRAYFIDEFRKYKECKSEFLLETGKKIEKEARNFRENLKKRIFKK